MRIPHQTSRNLESLFKERGVDLDKIDSFDNLAPTFANVLLYILSFYKPSRARFDQLLKKVKPAREPQPTYDRLLIVARFLYLANMALDHLKVMDFSIIRGKTGYYFWKLGIVGFWKNHFTQKLGSKA